MINGIYFLLRRCSRTEVLHQSTGQVSVRKDIGVYTRACTLTSQMHLLHLSVHCVPVYVYVIFIEQQYTHMQDHIMDTHGLVCDSVRACARVGMCVCVCVFVTPT